MTNQLEFRKEKKMRSIEDLNLTNKRVLIRADLNVPLNSKQDITDTTRIDSFLPTLELVLSKGGKPIVISHLGRPKGQKDPKLSLKPVSDYIAGKINKTVTFLNDCLGTEVEQKSNSIADNEVLILENLRFYSQEKSNDPSFAKSLSNLADIYVNDAFATAHRSHASITGVTELVTEKAPGLLMQKEINYYQKALVDPARPLCIIIGGAKVSSKLEALMNIATLADKIIIGGAMANTFLAAQGMQMGRSLYEQDLFPKIIELLAILAKKGCKLYLPVDFRIGSSLKAKDLPTIVTSQEIPADSMALDIGPASSLLFETAVKNASTIVWNGPMGAFENELYSEGTFELTKAVASASGLTVAGGGDTIAAITQMEMSHKFDYISTGGGAFLSLLEGKELPGFKALG